MNVIAPRQNRGRNRWSGHPNKARRAKYGMAKIRMFSTKPYDSSGFLAANQGHELAFLDTRLDATTVDLAAGADAVCVFVNDDLSAVVLQALRDVGVRCVALRCAGFNNVDLDAAERLGIVVVHVPAYSPNAVAEHTLALILALNRRIHRAYNRVRDGNFALDGLVGFDLAGKTVGVVGTGRIGAIVARLLWHLRCRVLAVDLLRDPHLLELGVEYVELDQALAQSVIISLNCPLTPQTHHLIDDAAIAAMRRGVMLVNTGRGALIDTRAAIAGLKSGQVGSLAIDVYEEEADLFFEDRSEEIIEDDVFARLLTFPNVLITAHQAFLTHEALNAIAETTMRNVTEVFSGGDVSNRVRR
jgi:D-lactate dehydrogenase